MVVVVVVAVVVMGGATIVTHQLWAFDGLVLAVPHKRHLPGSTLLVLVMVMALQVGSSSHAALHCGTSAAVRAAQALWKSTSYSSVAVQ